MLDIPAELVEKMTDSPNSFPNEFVVEVSMNSVLLCRCVVIISSAVGFFIEYP